MNDELRNLKPGDLGWIISKHGEIYTQEFQFDITFEVNIAAKAVALLKKANTFDTFWIYEIEGKRAGSIAISKLSDQVAFINFVLVLNEFRGKGVAQTLMNKAIGHARADGMTIIRLETYSCLKNARKLYKKLGFTITEPPKQIAKFGQSFDQEFWQLGL